MTELAALSASALAAGYRDRRYSPVDVVEDCLATISRLDPLLNTFLTVAEDARSQAERAQRALRDGGGGPLLGLPVAVKDLTVTSNLRTTFGSALFADNVPQHDDSVAERLRQAGAIIIGKTNTPAFGYGALTQNDLLGPTRNPYDTSYTSGGSSGGSAAAVAAGMVPLAIGSDFGGSVRMPASFCGIVGFRPAIGTIPVYPRAHMWQALSAPGTFGRNVEDAALLAWALSGPDPRDPVSLRAPPWPRPELKSGAPRRLRIAASATLGLAEVDKRVADVFEDAVQRMCREHDVRAIAPSLPAGFQKAYETIRGAFLQNEFAPLVAKHADRLSPTLKWNVARGDGISAADLMQAERVRMQAYSAVLEFLDEYDCLATVAAPIPPFPISQSEVLSINGKDLRNIIDYSAVALIGTMTGFPCLSIPCGMTAEGLPIGLQLIGTPARQADLLGFAAALEHLPGFGYRPPRLGSELQQRKDS